MYDNTCLKGLRVQDISSYNSGPIAAQILGDLGADVWKIERVGSGDPTRAMGPFVKGESLYYPHLNRNKRSMTLNYASPAGKEIFLEIAKDADVIVENFVAGKMKKLGLDYETLREINPRIIMLSITGFGQKDSPYTYKPAFDIMSQAFSGIVATTGRPGQAGVKAGPAIIDEMSGWWGALAILAALYERTISGEGQHIDLSMVDCGINSLEHMITQYGVTGVVDGRLGNRHANSVPCGGFNSSDGEETFFMAIANNKQFFSLLDLMGHPELKEDERFNTPSARVEYRDIVEPMVNEFTSKYSRDEILKLLEEANIPCAPVNTIPDLWEEPHFRQRKEIVNLDHPVIGKVPVTVTPFRPSRTPLRVETAAPMLGADTDDILSGQLGRGKEEIEKLRAEGII